MELEKIRYRYFLNTQATQSNRAVLNGVYFSVDAFLLFQNQIQTEQQAYDYAQNALLEIHLLPFQDEFRLKMLHALGQKKEENTQEKSIVLQLRVNLFEKKALEISSNGTAFLSELEKYVFEKLEIHLMQPFSGFFPDTIDKVAVQENHRKQKKQNRLIPFQSLYPFSGTISACVKSDDDVYLLDDLYCMNPACDCNEVTCIAFSFDPSTGKEIVHGGFKYHLLKKTFKILPDFPSKFNAQMWMKTFSENHFIDLPLLFSKRYSFLRSV